MLSSSSTTRIVGCIDRSRSMSPPQAPRAAPRLEIIARLDVAPTLGLDPDRHLQREIERRRVSGAIRSHGEQELRATLAIDTVAGVANRALALGRVRLLRVHLVGERVVEVELRGELEPRRRVRCGADLEVHV